MSNLSSKEVHQFWSQYIDPSVYRVIVFMEGVEAWTLDGDPEVENAVTELDNRLNNGKVEFLGQEKIMQVCLSLKMGRAVRILQLLDVACPGATSKLMETADDQDHLNIGENFKQRNFMFERLRLLTIVLAKPRLEAVLKTLEEEKA